MYPELLQKATLFALLSKIDRDLAQVARSEGCPACGGAVHDAAYERKPRGGPKLPEEYSRRLSLCCGRRGCRRRKLPPSCLFLGRRVYWGAVVLVVTALRQRRVGGSAARQVRDWLGVPARTIERWMHWFQQAFPASALWRRVRGRVPVDVRDDGLPDRLLACFEHALGDATAAVVACLRLFAEGAR